jgi:hypothetical protein
MLTRWDECYSDENLRHDPHGLRAKPGWHWDLRHTLRSRMPTICHLEMGGLKNIISSISGKVLFHREKS